MLKWLGIYCKGKRRKEQLTNYVKTFKYAVSGVEAITVM